MLKSHIEHVQSSTRRVMLVVQAAVLAAVGFAPFVLISSASAAPQLPSRSASITTARPGQNFDITFQFNTTADASDVERIEIEFCDTPLGTCNGTAGTDVPTIPSSTTLSQGGWDNTPGFSGYTRVDGDSSSASDANQIEISRTNTTNESGKTGLTVGFTGLTHVATANKTFFARIRLYNDATAGVLVWEGVTAQSSTQTLTVNARVQEILSFCIGATAVDDATTSVGADCSAISGNSVNLGVLDSGAVNVSPITVGNGGDGNNGVAMLRTNAVNGAVIDYKTVQDNSSGKLKVASAACSGTLNTDQCFNSTGTTANTVVSGVEEFGMTIAGVNTASTTSYTATYAGDTYNLRRNAEYDGNSSNTTYVSEAGINIGAPYTTTNQFAWDDTGNADRIAASSTVVDDEALILKFAATANITTPTGQYSVQSDFIATPTF